MPFSMILACWLVLICSIDGPGRVLRLGQETARLVLEPRSAFRQGMPVQRYLLSGESEYL